MSDLRFARAYLAARNESNVVADEKSAIVEIDQAIAETTRAAIVDGKNPDDHPPIDASLKHKDRLRKALTLLQSAQRDLTFVPEDDKAAMGWRRRAVGDVADAIRFARKAIRDDLRDDING